MSIAPYPPYHPTGVDRLVAIPARWDALRLKRATAITNRVSLRPLAGIDDDLMRFSAELQEMLREIAA